MEDPSRQLLVRKRAVVKSALTIQENFLEHFQINSMEDHEQIEFRLEQIKLIQPRFEGIQAEIDLMDSDPEVELREREGFNNRFCQLVAHCKVLIRNSQFNVEKVPRVEPHFSSPVRDSQPCVESVRLPEIRLPTFDGNIVNWRYFRNLVSELIVNNSSLKETAKFYHLYSCLSPALQQAVSNIPHSANNFAIAWGFLVARYDNPRLLINAHIEQIFNPPEYQSGSAASLRSLVDHINANLESLHSLELEVPIEDLFIQKILLDRFDQETLKAWETQSQVDVVPTLRDVLDFIEQRARVLDVTLGNPSSSHAKNVGQNKPRIPPVKASSNVQCYYCQQSHLIYYCQKFRSLTVDDRLKQVDKLKLCKNCLIKSTPNHQCSMLACRICSKRHHTLLHLDFPRNGRVSPPFQGDRRNNFQRSYVVNQSSFGRGGNRVRGRGGFSGRGRGSPNHSGRNSPDQEYSRSNFYQCNANSSNVNSNLSSSQLASNVTMTSATTHLSDASSPCLLATAVVLVSAGNNIPIKCRALLDGGSDCNLMTTACKKRLGLTSQPIDINVSGLCLASHSVSESVNISLRSTCTDFQVEAQCLLVERITSNLPSVDVDIRSWYLPSELIYADPEFYLAKPIDILLGADVFFNILLPGRLSPGPQLPNIQRTFLGWVVAGSIPSNSLGSKVSAVSSSRRTYCAISERITNEQLNSQLKRFWEIEDCSRFNACQAKDPVEQHYVQTVTRDSLGRYMVTLPKKPNHSSLGISKPMALKRFFSLEKRLARDSELRKEYVSFMSEYQMLGHMQLASSIRSENVYYIPHHPVFKPSSLSTKLRVVFDASALTTSGLSLNDTLQVGPTVQPDLTSTILNFRTKDVALVADIIKMYRQVKVSPEDQKLQRIFWRSSPQDPLLEFELNTVTYGTAPAAFLATRTLNQLAIDEGDSYPLAASAVMENFYVDDLISSHDSAEQAISVYQQLTTMLDQGGFELHKWASNSPQVLEQIPFESQAISNIKSFDESADSSIQTLGLLWHVDNDTFKIQHKDSLDHQDKPFTKRSILSTIASIFDPLGLIVPIIILCKIFMQKLWMAKIDWDERVKGELLNSWLAIWSHLPDITKISIPRLIKPVGSPEIVYLHVFADASKLAYGAVAYLVTFTNVRSASHIILAKSRVAPLKPMTIPRLELSAALLAAKLVYKIKSALNLMIHQTWLWSDSTIVLSWIRRQPSEFKTFVSSRLCEIDELTHNDIWLHVPSKQNPADCITRGATPLELMKESRWWHGPQWLTQDQEAWPSQPTLSSDQSEVKHCNVSIVQNDLNQDLILKHSSYLKLIRVMAYVRRFIHNLKSPSVSRFNGPLSPVELDGAFNSCAKIIQSAAYPAEILALKQGELINSKSSILSLRPFLDETDLLRVGGRLEHSLLPFGSKHQILLPRNHHFVKIYIRYIHLKLCHASAQAVMAEVRQRLWIPSLKGTIRQIHRACVTCFKDRAVASQQIMGQLPDCRVQPSPVFSNVGIDYAGPVNVKFGGPRSRATQKCYFAVFVCMVTTAVHVELVTSLTTKSFLDAFSRFTSRRGFPSIVYSDNATNFKGAYREMIELFQLLDSQDFQDEIQTAVSKFNITWKFSPPRSPHFGGLWETMIKSFKSRLRKVTIGRVCTFEEMLTLVTFIESILNSRPLCKMSEDIDDFHFLSPAHFLIGRSLVTLPISNFQDIPIGRLDRYQQLQHSLSNLWNFWSRDYLMSLQRLAKWKVPFSNLTLRQPVLVIEDSPMVNTWCLGIIVELHPGRDGFVRVVTVQTKDGFFKRAVNKIAPLPFDKEE